MLPVAGHPSSTSMRLNDGWPQTQWTKRRSHRMCTGAAVCGCTRCCITNACCNGGRGVQQRALLNCSGAPCLVSAIARSTTPLYSRTPFVLSQLEVFASAWQMSLLPVDDNFRHNVGTDKKNCAYNPHKSTCTPDDTTIHMHTLEHASMRVHACMCTHAHAKCSVRTRACVRARTHKRTHTHARICARTCIGTHALSMLASSSWCTQLVHVQKSTTQRAFDLFLQIKICSEEEASHTLSSSSFSSSSSSIEASL